MPFLIAKRIFDLFVCAVAFPPFVVIACVVSIAIKLDDGGPVFYIADRIGKDCTHLRMLKFRSMRIDAANILNSDGSTYNSSHDSRVTKVGKIIRSTSIDETPQIINILLGQMSVIGPRASEWSALNTYREDELDKMKVKPGVTGLTQAYYRNSISVREKRLLDAWYARNASALLDLKILFKTFSTVLRRSNLYTNE